MPPPTTSMLSGSSSSASAPVESMIRGSSGRPGSATDSEPAAMMHCPNPITCRPSGPSTCRWFGPTKRASPCTTRTLRCFAIPASPRVSFPTTPSFQARSGSSSMAGLPNTIPCSAMWAASSITRAACSSALDGMQPTLRQTPPSVSQRSTSVTSRPRSAARNAAV